MSNSTSNSTLPKGEADHNLYGYEPSRTTAYAYMALFALSAFVHFIMMFPLRAAFFIPLILGCAMEAGGYYCRAWSAANTHKILPFVISGLLILAAPPMLAATVYMTFGRIIRNLKAASFSIISPRWLTSLFVLGDVVCLGSQLAGSVLRASDDLKTNQTGSHIVLAGLILQVAMFSFFGLLVAVFHIRYRFSEDTGLGWKKHVIVLYILSIVFVVRNIVRIVEFTQSADGYIATHESMLYLFDGSFMLFVSVLLVFVHPGRLLREARRSRKMDRFTIGSEMVPIIHS
ncbi:RTA1-domain-containing protein [Stipitochalara longipes BDJ]|nr:RTA1-domain-containing protein [Stipitochalara longipes BDJ]